MKLLALRQQQENEEHYKKVNLIFIWKYPLEYNNLDIFVSRVFWIVFYRLESVLIYQSIFCLHIDVSTSIRR